MPRPTEQGLNPQKVVEQFIEEEMGLYLESDLPEVRAIYQQQRAAFYEGELKKLANVTVLDQNNTSQTFEHSSIYLVIKRSLQKRFLITKTYN